VTPALHAYLNELPAETPETPELAASADEGED
jgi:hypothetical protein